MTMNRTQRINILGPIAGGFFCLLCSIYFLKSYNNIESTNFKEVEVTLKDKLGIIESYDPPNISLCIRFNEWPNQEFYLNSPIIYK
jgi:hypothetical protein